ncbi:hypothetical protein [Vibrio vulnificus]|nr:hypothetical protein [Vibrio vulnificus]
MTMKILIGVVIGVFIASQNPELAESIRQNSLLLFSKVGGLF